jgi:hypothetical protein
VSGGFGGTRSGGSGCGGPRSGVGSSTPDPVEVGSRHHGLLNGYGKAVVEASINSFFLLLLLDRLNNKSPLKKTLFSTFF